MRRKSLFLSLLLVCGSVSAEDVIVFRGNSRHSGVYEAPGVPRFNSVKWQFHTGGMVIGSPVVSGHVVYVGSTDGNVYAIDENSGGQKWKYAVKSRVPSTPTVQAGIVYFTAYDGNLYAVDAAGGALKWKFRTEGERRFAGKHLHGTQPAAEVMPDPFDCYLSSPVIANGAVYFGSGDGNVYAVDAASGTLKWKFKTGDVVHASPAIADGTVFIGSWDSYFYAIDAETGKQKWKFKTGEDHEIYNQVGIQSSAAVLDGIVYFGCRDSHLYALDAATGEKRWAFSANGSWIVGSPAVRQGKVYFPTSDSSSLFEVDAGTGKVLRSLTFNHWYLYSSPALAGNTLYIGSTQGKLVAVGLDDLKPLWTYETDAAKQHTAEFVKPDGTPNGSALFHGDFYDDMVSGVERVMSMGSILSSPVVVDNVVYFGSADGNLYALM
ncbi:MAG TPA: PQQ-binding-like beta-propeller repeat protein [Candidatus Sulfotelmatobacter sp.]|nr:PQQ-binding-like beta-propeller repeat protein [Candidatus Sulfotelmatobacter sp.]